MRNIHGDEFFLYSVFFLLSFFFLFERRMDWYLELVSVDFLGMEKLCKNKTEERREKQTQR